MNFNVPQFIEVQDKIAFQLTARQLGIFALGGVIEFALWSLFEGWVFYVCAVIVAVIVILFAFFKPSGMSLSVFIKRGFFYSFKPKVMIWEKGEKRIEDAVVDKKKVSKKQGISVRNFSKEEKMKKIDSFANILDRKK